MDKAKLVEIYCVVDEFCKGADRYMAPKTLVEDGKCGRHRKPMMSDSEVMTILIMFHLSRIRDLRSFYLGYIKRHCQQELPKQLFYNHQIEHTRHRSIHNFCSNLLAGLIAYQSLEQKPSLDLEHVVNNLRRA